MAETKNGRIKVFLWRHVRGGRKRYTKWILFDGVVIPKIIIDENDSIFVLVKNCHHHGDSVEYFEEEEIYKL